MKKHYLVSSLCLALAGAAQAQTTPDGADIERVTVRGAYFGQQMADAVKTPTLLIDTPQSVSVVTREQIDEQNFMDIADILLYTPGASIGQGENHRDQFTIRGQNTTADFFIDGLRDDVQYFRPLYNLERVEILRGANALLFGRGGGGGIINRVTKTARINESFNSVAANLNSFGSGMLASDSNISLDSDQALRLNALYERIDNHRDFNHGERFAVNPTYTLKVNSDTNLVLSYEYINDDRFVDRGVPSLNGRPLEGVRDTFFGDRDVNTTQFEGHITRARVDHTLSEEWTLNTTFQYADYDKFYANLYPVAFDDASQLVTFDGYNDSQDRNNVLAQINLIGQISTGNVEHTILMGAEYGDQRSQNVRQEANFPNGPEVANINIRPRDSVLFSDPIISPAVEFVAPIRDTNSDVMFTSVFFQDEITLSEEWTLVAGLRYDRFDIDVTDYIQIGIDNGTVDPNVFSSESYAAVAGDGNNGYLSRTDNEVSPRVGVIYQPNDDLSFYASLSKSFLPRSGDQFLSLDLTSASLAPEEFENRELGVKWNVLPSLAFTAAVFELEREGGTTVDPNNPERSIIVGTKTRGAELQLVGYITDKLSVNAGYSYLDANEMGRVVDGQINNRVLAQVPEHMASLWTRYSYTERLGFGLGVSYQGAQYTSLSNAVELPSFTRVDAAVFYNVNDALSVQLNVENLFDKEYFPAAHNDNNITTGEPLNARLGVTYQF
ncbi:TonB-dependent receptor [Alteromonas sp. CYL-A6]|uniref:TonB-dependent receptor n=1 Tax=Alteromonas nitratireducens TaxID=3390813 RepID=UPI0034B58091